MIFKNPVVFALIFSMCLVSSVSAFQRDTATHFYLINYTVRAQQMWNPAVNKFFRSYNLPTVGTITRFAAINAGYCKGRFLTTVGLALGGNDKVSAGYETGSEQIDLSLEELYRIYKNKYVDVYAGASIDAYETDYSGDYIFDSTQIPSKTKEMPEFDADEWSVVLSPRVMLWHRLSQKLPVLRNFRIGAEAGYAMRVFALSTNVSDYGPYYGYHNPAAYDTYHRPPDSHHIGNLFRSGFFIGLQLNFCVDRSYLFYR
jgi:hypothetical protein